MTNDFTQLQIDDGQTRPLTFEGYSPHPLCVECDGKEILRLESNGNLIVQSDKIDEAGKQFISWVKNACVEIGGETPFKDAYTQSLEEQVKTLSSRVTTLEEALIKMVTNVGSLCIAYEDMAKDDTLEIEGIKIEPDVCLTVAAAFEEAATRYAKDLQDLNITIKRV